MIKIFWVLLFACNTTLAQTGIEGKLGSFANTPFSIKTNQSALNDYAGITIGQGKTDDNGQFNIKINLEEVQPVNLFIGNLFFILWIKPNSTLTIRDAASGQFIFSGSTAPENQVLYLTGLMQPYTISPNTGMDKFVPERHLAYLDSIEAKRLNTLNETAGSNSLSKKFIAYCKTEIVNYSHFNKNQYPSLLKATGKIKDNDIPENYFSFWNKFKLAEDSTASNSYQHALQNFIEYRALQKIGKSQTGTANAWQEVFRTADTLLNHSPLTLQKQKTDYLLLLIRYFNFTSLTRDEMDIYKRQFPLSASVPVIENLWQKKSGAADVTPSFRLINNLGKWVDIKDFRGKVVYIDFWGAWCKACLLNMPHAKKLKEKFRGKDVVFLYIDFYDTKEKWINAVVKNSIEGTHLKAEKSDEQYFGNVFNINQGFPRYALVDKKGKLVTISAPQPQEQAANDLIKKYLEE